MTKSLKLPLVIMAFVVVVLSVAGLTASTWMKSPQERLAERDAPAPTTITAAVERRQLDQTVVVRGTVGAKNATEVSPAAAPDTKPIVTGLRTKHGAMVRSGSVLFEIGGRPVVALPGATPAYRDLRPGSTGKDVAQLQAALASLSYAVEPDRKGQFGSGTKRALSRYLDDLGYTATPTSSDDVANLDAAKRDALAAKRALADAKEQLKAAKKGSAEYADLRKAVTRAQEDLTLAEDRVNTIEAETGPMLPLSEYVFVPSMPARVSQLTAKVGGEVQPPAAVLSGGSLVVQSRVSEANRAALKPGMKVRIRGEASGLQADGVIESVGAYVSGTEQQEAGAPVTVRFTRNVDWNQYGAEVRLTVITASTPQKVLVVPVSAVFMQTDGSTAVVKQEDGAERRVAVETAGEANGYVEVSGDLTEGDLVVVGAAP